MVVTEGTVTLILTAFGCALVVYVILFIWRIFIGNYW